MSHELIDRSPDLRRLRDDGYELEIRGGHLLIHNVPYVRADKSVGLGTLVSTLRLAGDVTTTPDTHVATFAGDCPCDTNGVPLTHIISSSRQQVAPDLYIDHTFSSKPANGYADYYEKITHYAALVAGPAQVIDPKATPRRYAVMQADSAESPFVYIDNASARAGIEAINAKLAGAKVAIIGLGGSGSYLLDFIAKTPVAEIHLYDADEFAQHNAFRAPGAATVEELRAKPKKVVYLAERYSEMHRGIRAHDEMISASNAEQLGGADVVFTCMDEGAAKADLITALERLDVTFIDLGIGIQADEGALHGIVRVTTSSPGHRKHVHEGHRIPLGIGGPDDYASNIQIAELNALNAALAIIKWKKLRGVYADLEGEMHSLYTLDGNHLINEDSAR
ncbi:MAG TPA: ThiF family adenylyltransferase [Candidatus Baltobacteraceae bacterium]|nr:ThiF family adenylyltransferase [Candidatus Baltobacteraceae bacterium]